MIFGNPFNLPIPSKVREGTTKGDLVRQVLPQDWTFDYALPQLWLEHFKGNLYYRMVCNCVTVYPPGEYEIFGAVLDLTSGNVYPL